jgi:hypothetical protein
MKFGLEEVAPSNAWLLKTLDLTSRHDVSFYDAAYHSLALIHGGVFVTADSRHANKVKESGSVVELSEWELQSESPGELSLARNAMRGKQERGDHVPNSPNSRDDTREDWYPSSLVRT